jgi:hypothetical protein
MVGGIAKFVSGGRGAKLAGLRRVSLAALIMLVAQYGLGMFLNLYVNVPAADAHAGFMQEVANGPFALTVHATLGLALIVTAIVLLVRAVRVEDRLVAMLATAGLTAIGGAFAAGEIFVRNGQSGASLAMALLTAVAMLSYVGVLAWTARRQAAHAVHRGVVLVQHAADPLATSSRPPWSAPPLPRRDGVASGSGGWPRPGG